MLLSSGSERVGGKGRQLAGQHKILYPESSQNTWLVNSHQMRPQGSQNSWEK